MVVGAIFKKDRSGKYLTDKNGNYIIDQHKSQELLNSAFPEKGNEEAQATETFESKLREIEKERKNN